MFAACKIHVEYGTVCWQTLGSTEARRGVDKYLCYLQESTELQRDIVRWLNFLFYRLQLAGKTFCIFSVEDVESDQNWSGHFSSDCQPHVGHLNFGQGLVSALEGHVEKQPCCSAGSSESGGGLWPNTIRQLKSSKFGSIYSGILHTNHPSPLLWQIVD